MKKKSYKNDLEKAGLNGPVKQIKQTEYDPVCRDGRWVPGVLCDSAIGNTLKSFDPNGIIREEQFFKIDGLRMIFRNDEAGRRETITHYNKGGEIKDTMYFYYNEAGENTEVRTEYPGKSEASLQVSKTIYNEEGLATEYLSLTDGVQSSRTTYSYDEKGRKTEQLMYNKHDLLDRRIETSYDDVARTETSKSYNEAGELKDHTITYFGPDGGYIGSSRDGVYKPYKHPRPNECKYDYYKNWIEEVRYEWNDDGNSRPENISFRQISYYGEPSADVPFSIHDTVYDMATIYNPIPPATTAGALTPEQWQWVAEGGETHDPFRATRYYTALHGFFPGILRISSYDVDLWSLRRYLVSSFGAAEVWVQSEQDGNAYDELFQRYVLVFARNKYLLEADEVQHINSWHYSFSGKPADPEVQKANYVQFGDITLYHPPGAAGGRDLIFEQELQEIIDSFEVKKKEETPQISMVTVMGNSFSLKAYTVKDDFIINELDLNYGNGFGKFHEDLMKRFSTTKQGLILFHGEPGTGKTFYVRHLLRRMSESKKVVIYMPPNMVDHLVEPSFMSFISGQVSALAAGGKSCVLLIEDAEPLLVARDENTRIQGITNLLNMTDGLLNDMLGLQIICTFNVPLKQLDKALLRPGRLIARKEFKALPEFEANVLANSLGIKHVFNRPATLGEIYSKAPDKKMLTHDA